MKAIFKAKPEKGVEMRDIPIPEAGSREVLIKIKAASICGTDVHIYKWDEWAASRMKLPIIIGHEFAGEVVKAGEQVTKLKIGDMVSGETHLYCGKCYQCHTGNAHICENVKLRGIDAPGCFAEYHVSHEDHLWVNPSSLPVYLASVQEPLGNAVHTVFAQNVSGKTVAVFGNGCIGQSAIQICKALGASKVFAIDVRPYRLNKAKEMGADIIINALEEDPVKRILKETENGVDVFLEMAGFEKALAQGLAALKPGGEAAILGIFAKPVNVDVTNGIVFKDATIRGINGRKIFETWHMVASLLKEKKVNLDKLITHRMKFSEIDRAMELMMAGECGKVVLTW